MRMVTLRNGESVPEKSFNKVVDALRHVVDESPYGASMLMDIRIGLNGRSSAKSMFYDDLYELGLINKNGYMPSTVRKICANALCNDGRYNDSGALGLRSRRNMIEEPTRTPDMPSCKPSELIHS